MTFHNVSIKLPWTCKLGIFLAGCGINRIYRLDGISPNISIFHGFNNLPPCLVRIWGVEERKEKISLLITTPWLPSGVLLLQITQCHARSVSSQLRLFDIKQNDAKRKKQQVVKPFIPQVATGRECELHAASYVTDTCWFLLCSSSWELFFQYSL